MAAPAAAHKADMAALWRLVQIDLFGNIANAREGGGGHKGVVLGVEQQGGFADVAQQGFGGGAAVVVVFIGKAVHGGGKGVVKVAQAAAF